MPYETVIDAAQILRSTLHLLEHTQFPEKNSPTIAAVVQQLQAAIADLDIAQHKLEVRSVTLPQPGRVRMTDQ
jgi:hypothetical protein